MYPCRPQNVTSISTQVCKHLYGLFTHTEVTVQRWICRRGGPFDLTPRRMSVDV
jgi:hypothetical protein